MHSLWFQALHAHGRAGSFVKRPPYSERRQKRTKTSPGEEANGTSAGAANDSQPVLGLTNFEESQEVSALAGDAANQLQADESRGLGAAVQPVSLSDALDISEANPAPSLDPLTTLFGEADIQSPEQGSGDALLSTAEAPLLGQESIDSLLEALKPPLDLADTFPAPSPEVAFAPEGHPGQSLENPVLPTLGAPKNEESEALTSLGGIPSQQPPAAAGLQETVLLAQYENRTAADFVAGGSPAQSLCPPESNGLGPGSHNGLATLLEENYFVVRGGGEGALPAQPPQNETQVHHETNGLPGESAVHGGGEGTEPAQAPQNGTQLRQKAKGLPGKEAAAAKQKKKQEKEAERKEKRKAARQARLTQASDLPTSGVVS